LQINKEMEFGLICKASSKINLSLTFLAKFEKK